MYRYSLLNLKVGGQADQLESPCRLLQREYPATNMTLSTSLVPLRQQTIRSTNRRKSPRLSFTTVDSSCCEPRLRSGCPNSDGTPNRIGARTADGLHRERLLERDRLGRVADVDDEFAGIHAPVLCVHVVVTEGALVQVQDDVLCLAGIEADFAELLKLH